jgi:hypothetical protein
MDVHAPAEPEARPAVLEIGRPVKAALAFCWAASVLMGAVKVVTALGRAPNRPLIFDFHAFMVAGKLAWDGRLAEAYDVSTMVGLERQMGGHPVFMPWSYPPLFGLVMAPLSRLPIAVAFCLFSAGAFALFLLALRRLAPQSAWLVLATLAPCTIINLASGQNGFLTGALFAFAAACFLRRKPGQGGLAIGVLAFKPHMAVVWPVLLAVRGRWATAAVAGGVAVGLTVASVLVVGPEPFKAFAAATAQAGRYLAAGAYHLNRMTSLYASAISIGLPTGAALAVHVTGAVAVIAGVVRSGRALPERAQTGLAIMSTVFISPYFYDYDQTVFCVGLALLLPELMERLERRNLALLLGAVATAQAVGLPFNGLPIRLSLGGPLLLAIFAVTVRALAQATVGVQNASPAAAPVPIGGA